MAVATVSPPQPVVANIPEHLSTVTKFHVALVVDGVEYWYRAACEDCPWSFPTTSEVTAYWWSVHHFDVHNDPAAEL